ncbi:lamin tail domain-containing protein [Candidatus Uhrbacteria bacterium]|nr:lamin tail domain-containing protein [Candidatus Uhrbacteria bacterium]
MRGVYCYVSVLCGSIFGFLFFPHLALAADTDIVITEIAAYEKSDHEWIEIYNKGSAPVDSTGWKFFEDGTNHKLNAFRGDLVIDPGEYAVIADVAANTAGDYPSFSGTLIDSSWQTLHEDGESIALVAGDGSIVEQFTYLPATDGSLQRVVASAKDYTAANWKESAADTNTIGSGYVAPTQQSTPPPPAEQTAPTIPQNETQPQQSQSQQPPTAPKINSSWKPSRGDVVINEFVADPGDSPKEWIELYNNSPVSINLTGWMLEDGSRNGIALKGILGVSGSARFAVFEISNAILNNTGDSITLRNADGVEIDSVSYGDWDDGVIENNAPRAQDPASVARFPDGYNSFYSATDFKITEKPTKGESNILIAEKNTSEKKPTTSSIIISELFPYPFPATETRQEFIELYNKGDKAIDLDGWRIVAGNVSYVVSGKTASSTSVVAGGYFVIPRSVSTIALRNRGGEAVALYEPSKEKASATLSYKIDAPPNKSYARFDDGGYTWTDTPTSGEANKLTKANEPPYVALFVPLQGMIGEEIIFDASDTRDSDNDPLSFEWDFGDDSQKVNAPFSVTHTYHAAGIYEVILTVRAGSHEKIQTSHITISGSSTVQASSIPSVVDQKKSQNVPFNESLAASTATTSPAVVLNELLPNPSGRDRGQEFIELYNSSDVAVEISQWLIELQGGKSRHTISQGSVLKGRGFFTIPASGDSIVLRNSGDEIVLRDQHGTLIDSIDYEASPEGESFSRRTANDWIWTPTVSKGSQNVFIEEKKKIYASNENAPSAARNKQQSSGAAGNKTALEFATANFDRLREIKQNTWITVRGTVTVPPGVFDSKELYISDGENGMLVRNTKNALPFFSFGDQVEVHGSLKKYVSGPAVSFGPEGSVRAVPDADVAAVEPAQLSMQSVTDETLNAFVAVSGEVTQARWPNIYLKDTTGEIRAYIKKSTGIEKMDLQKGQLVDVNGIVSKTASGYRILPRTAADIVVTGSRRVEVAQDAEYTIVSDHTPWQSYGVAALVALAAVSGGLFFQYYQRRKNE